ncbi:uncharacterized protein LOC132181522 isoform X2 [Corylus avellana]|uniref:uncharacterized protein LOC132181522 isoform X2 n=1 Tax=Corylus avellana TaxID=13451 RepID=UPI00286D616F|nr:uncharacterized protein LOC132181522 isoform X2 [Corylus avellana]
MILNSAAATAMAVRCRPPLRPMCLGSNINTEQLRAQLDQLHSEAESTRAKDAAEKLQRQAAISVQNGKENDARQLLLQKKKIILALEKSKRRIELLDELSTKFNEAISLKENQLVGNVSLDLEVGREDAPSPVRIISPKQEKTEDLNENKEFEPNMLELDGREDLQPYSESRESLPVDKVPEDLEASLSVGIQNEDDIISSLNGISSYEDFLERLDQDLSNIEAELLTILRVSTLILDSNETEKNSRVQETLELLEGIRGIRKRITSIKLTKVETR